jgi:hypothetical protein
VTLGTAVSDGCWVIVEPLHPGYHVIHFHGTWNICPGCYQDVTYHLTILK